MWPVQYVSIKLKISYKSDGFLASYLVSSMNVMRNNLGNQIKMETCKMS